jgi:hypothetical protein
MQDNVALMYFEQCFKFYHLKFFDTMDISVKTKI